MMQLHWDDLIITVEKNDTHTILKWSGECNDLHPAEKLMPFFYSVLENVQGTVIMQFQKLQFMNSSTIHPLIQFLKVLDKKNIPVEIQYNKDSNWQKSSFKSMDFLVKVLKNIKIIET